MKFSVIGGTGRIGTRIVQTLFAVAPGSAVQKTNRTGRP